MGEGSPGHGPIHLLSASPAEIGFGGILWLLPGLDLVYLSLAIWLALFSTSRLPLLMLGVIRLQRIFVDARVFEVGLCFMSMAPCSSSILLMLEKEIRLCFVASWLVLSGMIFY